MRAQLWIYISVLMLLFLTTFTVQSLLILNLANIEVARSIFNATPGTSPDASDYLLGVAAYRQNALVKAYAIFQNVDKSYSDLIRWHTAHVYSQIGEWRTAIDTLEDGKFIVDQELYLSLNFEHVTELSFEEQRSWLSKLQSNRNWSVRYANWLLARRRFAEARGFIKSVPIYSEFVDAQLVVGQSYFYESGKVDLALKVFQQAHDLFDTAATAYWLGRTFAYQGHTDKAIPLLERAVSKESNASTVSWYLLELAMAYSDDKGCDKAKATFLRAMKDDELAANIELVDSARKHIVAQCLLP